MGAQTAKEPRPVQRVGVHYAVALVAISTGAALHTIGQDAPWASVLGWVLTSVALLGGGLLYLLKPGNRGILRGR